MRREDYDQKRENEEGPKDWSVPPQVVVPSRWSQFLKREPAPAFRGLLGFLALTSPTLLLMVGFLPLARYDDILPLVRDVLIGLFSYSNAFFFLGLVFIPLAGLRQVRRYSVLLATVFHAVNRWIVLTYLLSVTIYLLSIGMRDPGGLLVLSIFLFIPGYIVVIFTAAGKAVLRDPNPTDYRPQFDLKMDGLEGFHPTDLGRVSDGIARF